MNAPFRIPVDPQALAISAELESQMIRSAAADFEKRLAKIKRIERVEVEPEWLKDMVDWVRKHT